MDTENREMQTSPRMCTCIYVCLSICMFACAHWWLERMGGIPCLPWQKWKDFGGGELVPGCLGPTVRAQKKRSNKFYTTSTCVMWVYVFCEALLHFFQRNLFPLWQVTNNVHVEVLSVVVQGWGCLGACVTGTKTQTLAVTIIKLNTQLDRVKVRPITLKEVIRSVCVCDYTAGVDNHKEWNVFPFSLPS